MLENFFNYKLERIGKSLWYAVAKQPLFRFMTWTDKKLCGSREHYSKSEELSLVEGQSTLAEAAAACAWTALACGRCSLLAQGRKRIHFCPTERHPADNSALDLQELTCK